MANKSARRQPPAKPLKPTSLADAALTEAVRGPQKRNLSEAELKTARKGGIV